MPVIIYAAQRSPVAIFKDDHMADKYFVWLVSKGTRSIDWRLRLGHIALRCAAAASSSAAIGEDA